MAKSKGRKVNLYLDVEQDTYWSVDAHNGKHTIEVPVMFDEDIICRSKKGACFECVMAKSIMKFAKEHPTAFPHPVLHAYVTATTVYIVDKKKGTPTHAVGYNHNFSEIPHTFDSINRAQFISRFNGEGFLFKLYPMKSRAGEKRRPSEGGDDGGSRKPGTTRPPRHAPRSSRGAFQRAYAAKLMLSKAA